MSGWWRCSGERSSELRVPSTERGGLRAAFLFWSGGIKMVKGGGMQTVFWGVFPKHNNR
jgi:hypothetical protein